MPARLHGDRVMAGHGEAGAATLDYLLFVAGFLVPVGILLYWLMRALVVWFGSLETVIESPFF